MQGSQSMDPVTKTCPQCAETIPTAARVCPRCRQWLSLRSLRNPMVAMLCIGLPSALAMVLLLTGVLSRFARMMGPPPYYADHLDALAILESRKNWVETSNGPRLYLTGILTNRSEIAWQGVEFECRLFDTHGAMIDAASARGMLTIDPHSDSAFRATVAPGRAAGDYASYQIRVSTARNTRGL